MKLDISLHSLELDDPAAKSGLLEDFQKLKDKVINQEQGTENVPSYPHFYLFFFSRYLQNPFFGGYKNSHCITQHLF